MNHATPRLASLLILAAVTLAGCSSPKSKNGAADNANGPASSTTASDAGDTASSTPPTTNAPPAGGANQVPASADATVVDALTKSINAQLSAKSFRARLDSTFNDEEMARTIEYVAPDRFHMTSDRDETIIVGSNAWMRQNNGPWQKLPIDASRMIASVRDPKMIEEIRKSAEVKLIGPDTLDAKPMTVYQYTMHNVMGMEMTSHAKAWISVADNLPRRMETETEINGKRSKATITYFDYNADIKIEPPK